jgi:hypothetical protein
MSWKKTDLERLKAASLTDSLRKSRAPSRDGRDASGWRIVAIRSIPERQP